MSGPFAAKKKATIHNKHSFADFIEIVSAPGEESQKNLVTLIEKDPNSVALASFCVTSLGLINNQNRPWDEGGLSANIVANIREIHAQNPPCEQLMGNHEIPLIQDLSSQSKNKDITPSNPPKSPAFSFETRAEHVATDAGHPSPRNLPSTPHGPPTSATYPLPIGHPSTPASHSPPLMGYPTPGGN
ncbi:uncharacterized protein VP01_6564g1, partial [Puccinia sorghi]